MNSPSEYVRLPNRAACIPESSVMVDIETHGVDVSQHAILQIGAVHFDSQYQEIATFDACLTLPEDRCTDPDTVEWWLRTDAELYRQLSKRAEPHTEVLDRFTDWLPTRPHLWAWPACFDLAFIRSYAIRYEQQALIEKTHPYHWIDCRSWITGLRRGLITPRELDTLIHKPPPFEGRMHDGLYDARWQVVCLKWIADRIASLEQDDIASRP